MRKAANKLLYRCGYRIEKISRFERLQKALLQVEPRPKFLQIGANDGLRFDGLYFFVTRHRCPGVVVEPLPDVFGRLKFNYMDYPQVIAVNKAIHATAPSVTIYRVSDQGVAEMDDWAAGIASFDRGHLLRHGVPERHIKGETVECVPLMRLIAETGCEDAKLMQVDTEGYDAEIIRMLDFDGFRPLLIKYEHKNVSPEARKEASELLRRNGYRIAEEKGDTVAWQGLRL